MWSYWILESSSTDDVFKVDRFLEKPKAEATKSRNGNIWKYVLTPDIFDYLERSESLHSDWETRLIDAFEAMRKEKDVYWVRVKWTRYDTWSKIWFLKATIAFWLKNEEVKEDLKDFLQNLDLK